MKTHNCPTCSGRDPHRTSDVVVMTAPDKRGAARMREAWRAFWRHRGEEISVTWKWLPEPAKIIACTVSVVGMIASFAVGLAASVERQDAAECTEACGLIDAVGIRAEDGYRTACWCIVDGVPRRWQDIAPKQEAP